MKKSTKIIIVASVFFLLGMVAIIPVIGILSAIAIPNFVKYNQLAKRAEVPSIVNAIKTAEMAHYAIEGNYLAVEPFPVIQIEANGQKHIVPTSEQTIKLGLAGEELFGVYWVDLTVNDFIVHGVSDIDDDGNLAHFSATKDYPAAQNTNNDIF